MLLLPKIARVMVGIASETVPGCAARQEPSGSAKAEKVELDEVVEDDEDMFEIEEVQLDEEEAALSASIYTAASHHILIKSIKLLTQP